jgi:hypothetical protein
MTPVAVVAATPVSLVAAAELATTSPARLDQVNASLDLDATSAVPTLEAHKEGVGPSGADLNLANNQCRSGLFHPLNRT